MAVSMPAAHRNFTSNLRADLFDILASDPPDTSSTTERGPARSHWSSGYQELLVQTETAASNEREKIPDIKSIKVPMSLRDVKDTDHSIVSPPATLAPLKTGHFRPHQPPPRAPPRPVHLSQSLPNSATSSPRFGPLSMHKKKWKNYESRTSPREGEATPNFVVGVGQVEKELRRSKSCGEGRASSPLSIDFDTGSTNYDEHQDSVRDNQGYSYKNSTVGENQGYLNLEPEAGEGVGGAPKEEEFKCGALCLFLPGFGKAKPVRAKPAKPDEPEPIPKNNYNNNNIIISRSVSLEKFECGSWASSTIIPDIKTSSDDTGDFSTNLYFDLPLELIRSSGNDANSPVTAAFIFDNKELKGVLKTSGTGSAARKSVESSSRHVRFSTSTSPRSNPESPGSCITPRLRKAREDFNAFLEAQSA